MARRGRPPKQPKLVNHQLAIDQVVQFRKMFDLVMALPPEKLNEKHVALMEEGKSLMQQQCGIERFYLGCSDKQLDMAKSFWNGKRFIAAVGANRSGKSAFAGPMCTARHIRDRAKAEDLYWVISQTYNKSVEGAQRMLWEALPHDRFSREWDHETGFGDRGVVTYYPERLQNARSKPGVTIRFYNEEQKLNVFETVKVAGVWWDEASRESLLARLRTRVADTRGFILIATLPEELWLVVRLKEDPRSQWKYVQFATFDNEHNLPEGEIQAMESDMTPEERAMRILGEHVLLSGVIVPEFNPLLRPDGNVMASDTIERNTDWPVWLYIDVGHYTAALLMAVDKEGNMYVLDESYTAGKRCDENTDEIRMMLKRHNTHVDLLAGIFMDPAGWQYNAGNRATIAEQYSKCGIHCSPWTLTSEVGLKAMVNQVRKGFIDKRLWISDACPNLSKELRVWRWKMDEQQKVDLREKIDVGPDHAIDCLKAWVYTDPHYLQGAIGVFDTAEDLAMIGPTQERLWDGS
jgi:hypothetical protein